MLIGDMSHLLPESLIGTAMPLLKKSGKIKH